MPQHPPTILTHPGAADIIRLPQGPGATLSHIPTTLASRSLPEEMFHNPPLEPVQASESKIPSTFPIGRRAAEPLPHRRKLPNLSHWVSPTALTAALERYNRALDRAGQNLETAGVVDESLRAYKRVRFDETIARLDGRLALPEGSKQCVKLEQDPEAAKAEEDAFWASAFAEPEMGGKDSVPAVRDQSTQVSHVKREDSPLLHSLSREPALAGTHTSPPIPLPLPHRPREPDTLQDPSVPLSCAATVTVATSKAPPTTKQDSSLDSDDDFTLIPHAQSPDTKNSSHPGIGSHSPMSSPELVCVKTEDVQVESEVVGPEDWTLI